MLKAKDMIIKSIKSGINMKFTEFLTFNDIKLENNIVDKFFHNINLDIPVYMSSETIEYFGYEGTFKKQKEKINELIKNNFIEYKNQSYWIYDNDKYNTFLIEYNKKLDNLESLKRDSKLYPLVDKSKGKSTTKHLIIMPEMFKEMLMLCGTDKGKQVRKYYIKMVDALHLYIEYQNKMIINTLEQKLDRISLDMKETNETLKEERKKADDDRKKAEERDKIQSANIDRLLGYATETNETLKVVAKNHVEVNKLTKNQQCKLVILKDSTDNELPFNVIRRQNISIESTINEHKEKYDVDLTMWFELEQPNAMAFYNIIKKELKEYMNISGFWFGLKNITEEEFKQKIYDINKRRTRN